MAESGSGGDVDRGLISSDTAIPSKQHGTLIVAATTARYVPVEGPCCDYSGTHQRACSPTVLDRQCSAGPPSSTQAHRAGGAY